MIDTFTYDWPETTWNDPEKLKVFKDKVHKTKMEHLHNILFMFPKFWIGKKIEKEKGESTLGYLGEHWEEFKKAMDLGFDTKKVREFLLANWENKLKVDSLFPDLDFNKNAEKIKAEILTLADWKFDSPKDLSKTIGDYLKSKLDYDFVLLLRLSNHIQRDIQLKSKETGISIWKILATDFNVNISESEQEQLFEVVKKGDNKKIWNLIKQILIKDSDNITIPQFAINDIRQFVEYEKEYWSSYIPNRLDPVDEDVIEKNTKDFEELYDLLLTNDSEKILSFIKSSNPRLLEIVSEIIIWNNYFNSLEYADYWANEISDLLSWGIGVCRHFSEAMKLIYNEMATEYFPFSEMVTVTNFGTQHVYNKLFYVDEDSFNMEHKGTIQEQYIDVTKFIDKGRLFIDDSETLNKEREFFSQNNQQKSETEKLA